MTDPNIILTNLGIGAAFAYVMGALKRANGIPWINEHTHKINALIRTITAGAATLGIDYTWSGISGGGHTLVFIIPAGPVLLHGGWQWFCQYAIQHGWGKVLGMDNGNNPKAPVPPTVPPQSSAIDPPSVLGLSHYGARTRI